MVYLKDSNIAAVVTSVEWLLPDPVTLQDCIVVRNGQHSHHPAVPLSVLTIGNIGRGIHSDSPHKGLSASHDFRLIPAFGESRALLASGAEHEQFTALLSPGSQSASAIKRMVAFTTPRVPGLTRLLSSPVHLATIGQSLMFETLQQIAPGTSLGVMIGNKYSLGRTSIRAITRQSETVAIAKYASHKDGRDGRRTDRLKVEHKTLVALKSLPFLAESVPVPLDYVRGHLGDALITNAFAGEPAPITISPSMKEWLDSCQFGGETQVSSTSLVRELIEQGDDASDDALLKSATSRALENIGAELVPRTVVHGDFVPWNIVLVDGLPRVFDWEYAYLDGIPGWDEAFFQLRLGYLNSGWTTEQVVQEARELADNPPQPYDSATYRNVILMVMVHLILRDRWEQRTNRTVPVRQAIEELLVNEWLH